MEDCLTLILDKRNGLLINKRYYKYFIRKKRIWDIKCLEVMYLVHEYGKRKIGEYYTKLSGNPAPKIGGWGYITVEMSRFMDHGYNKIIQNSGWISMSITYCQICGRYMDNCKCWSNPRLVNEDEYDRLRKIYKSVRMKNKIYKIT